MLENKAPTLRQLEAEVFSGKFTSAISTLTSMMDRMDRRGPGQLLKSQSGSREDALNIYSRLAAVIAVLLCDSRVKFGGKEFTYLMLHKRTISTIFRVTSFGNMDYIVTLASSRGQADPKSGRANMLKGMIAATIDSPVLKPESVMKQIPPVERAVFWMSLLDRDYYLTDDDEKRRREVMALAPLILESTMPELFLLRLSNVWMNCSYFNDAEKHEIKRSLNQIIRNSLKKMGVNERDFPADRIRGEKPRLAVLSEQFGHQHAMFRCYSPAIKQLVENFELVLVTAEETIDEISETLFDRVEKFPVTTPIDEVIEKIEAVDADVIYYPSIGMQAWTVMACQLRLAPIQLMTLGHPATSMSEAMDYVVVRERSLGDPDCFSETVVLSDNDAFAFSFHPHSEKIEKGERPLSPETVRIAVPSNGNKISPALLDCCSRVCERVERPVEFHFFPNMPEAQTLELQQHIERLMPCKLHMGTDYLSYMKLIGGCDIQLSPFPFGNANGYMDGLLMGLPIVSMDGPEVHSHADNVMGRLAGLPEFCLTSSPDEYVDAIVRLVENDSERREVSQALLEKDIESIFFTKEVSRDFADLVQWLYENHEKIQDSNRKCWRIEDRSLVSGVTT